MDQTMQQDQYAKNEPHRGIPPISLKWIRAKIIVQRPTACGLSRLLFAGVPPAGG
jgi:hypothetical protein